jgi:hypothetical protein
MDIPPASTPVVCDMTTAPDAAHQRLDEYQQLFARALISREKTSQGVRFRFRAEPGLQAHIEDLAAREKACCAFFAFEVTADGDHVVWDCAVSDNDAARAILDDFYHLPDRTSHSPAELRERLEGKGLTFIGDPIGLEQRVAK